MSEDIYSGKFFICKYDEGTAKNPDAESRLLLVNSDGRIVSEGWDYDNLPGLLDCAAQNGLPPAVTDIPSTILSRVRSVYSMTPAECILSLPETAKIAAEKVAKRVKPLAQRV